MTNKTSKLITSKQYHLWTDALHARSLARQSVNEWDRGAYVRWAVNTAWTVFEVVCVDVTGVGGLGMRFEERLNEALTSLGFTSLDWGQGIWQEVANLYKTRKDYTHIGIPDKDLFPNVAVAEYAISTIREAIKEINLHTGRKTPEWVEDDSDYGLLTIGITTYPPSMHNTHPEAGVHLEDYIVRIVIVSQGNEIETDILPPWVPYEPRIQQIQNRTTAPMTAIRVYYGDRLLEEREVFVRG